MRKGQFGVKAACLARWNREQQAPGPEAPEAAVAGWHPSGFRANSAPRRDKVVVVRPRKGAQVARFQWNTWRASGDSNARPPPGSVRARDPRSAVSAGPSASHISRASKSRSRRTISIASHWAPKSGECADFTSCTCRGSLSRFSTWAYRAWGSPPRNPRWKWSA